MPGINLNLGLGLGLSSVIGAIKKWFQSDSYKADSVSPTLILDFANNRYAANSSAKNFSDILTFTRGSTGTYFNSSGVMQTAAIDTPRFDYDPVTGAALGLLVEGQRTNLTTYSVPTIGQWSATSSTTSYNNETSPDGTQTAALNTAQAATAVSYCHGPGTVNYVSGATYALSYFVKAGTSNRVQLTGASTAFGFSQYANFLLSGSGSVTASASCTAGIQQLSNGWYRVWIIAPASATAAGHTGAAIRIISGSEGRVPPLTFNGTESFYIWGSQVEVGSFPSSYIPTSGSAVTRLADSVTDTSSTPVPFASWYNQTEGTVFADFLFYDGASSYPRIFEIGDGGSNVNSQSLIQTTSTNQAGFNIYSGSAYQGFGFGNPDLRTTRNKFAGALKLNDSAAGYNGAIGGTDNAILMPTGQIRMDIGKSPSGTQAGFFHIRELRYYPARISNAELQRITS